MSKYIHSFTPEEQQRLIHQAEFLEPMLYAGIDFSGCECVLEIGCGVGAQLRILQRRFPKTKFTGLDASSAQLARARVIAGDHVELVEGSAYALPFPDASFDGVYICFVLEHLADPRRAMAEAARVLKPGGKLIASEVFNTGVHADPPRPAMMEYWRAFNDLQREFGGHPDVGLRLPNLAVDAGLTVLSLREITPHIDSRLDALQRRTWADYFCAIFASAADELVKRGRVTAALVDAMKADFDAVGSDRNSVMVYTAFQLSAKK